MLHGSGTQTCFAWITLSNATWFWPQRHPPPTSPALCLETRGRLQSSFLLLWSETTLLCPAANSHFRAELWLKKCILNEKSSFPFSFPLPAADSHPDSCFGAVINVFLLKKKKSHHPSLSFPASSPSSSWSSSQLWILTLPSFTISVIPALLPPLARLNISEKSNPASSRLHGTASPLVCAHSHLLSLGGMRPLACS